MPDYPHIHLRNLGQASKKFRSRGMNSSPPPSPVENRKEHAAKLRTQLVSLAGEITEFAKDQKLAGVENKRRGVPVTAIGRVDEQLRVGTLKLNSQGLELLSLKERGSASQEKRSANFFITKAQLKALHAALDRYEGHKSGKRPRRFNLFETVTSFRLATVDDLWTGQMDMLPDGEQVVEWEVWVRLGAQNLFNRYLDRLGLATSGEPTVFVDVAIYNFAATRTDIELLIRGTAAVVELRNASSFVTEYLDLDPEGRTESVEALTNLLLEPSSDSPVTTVLDTGVNHANPLLSIALPSDRCGSIDATWAANDHNGHGTNMAGIALYGDLEAKIEANLPVQLYTQLESVVVTAPHGTDHVPGHEAIVRAVNLLPQGGPSRIFCLAQTAPGDFSDGQQSALSAAVDRLAWNDGKASRLICVAAGNVPPTVDKRYPVGAYEMRNSEHRLESPAQAVNALTVGAATERQSDAWQGFAPVGDLCPSSRTSQTWEQHDAYKPDIVMEGGNHILDDDPLFSRATNHTLLLTTNKNYPNQPLGWTGETSAATARAAGLATRLQAQYPNFRAETLRGLMVHCAEWTPAMLARAKQLETLGISKQDAFETMLQCYGWGIPNEERLFRSAGDALTLIAEDKLQPYKLQDNRISLREMKYFKLPWPTDILKSLNQAEVELRCTLSYFGEPDPHAISRNRSDRYSSHRLRFDVRRPGEDDLDAISRINQYASEEDIEDIADAETFGLATTVGDPGWRLGDRKRRRGTIHHDIWTGKAFDLAGRDAVSVFPVRGWWGDRKNDGYEHRSVRFSVIVSVRTQETNVNLTAEAMSKVAAKNLVAAPTLITI